MPILPYLAAGKRAEAGQIDAEIAKTNASLPILIEKERLHRRLREQGRRLHRHLSRGPGRLGLGTGDPLVAILEQARVGFGMDVHTVKAGINYRFNWGGPVVAKY